MPAQGKRFESPDETRDVGKGIVEVLSFDGSSAAKMTFQPGWSWHEHVKPKAGTDSCQGNHFGYVLEGSLHVETDDGDKIDLSPGDTYAIHPGHDAWVNGDATFVTLEFQSETAASYAK